MMNSMKSMKPMKCMKSVAARVGGTFRSALLRNKTKQQEPVNKHEVEFAVKHELFIFNYDNLLEEYSNGTFNQEQLKGMEGFLYYFDVSRRDNSEETHRHCAAFYWGAYTREMLLVPNETFEFKCREIMSLMDADDFPYTLKRVEELVEKECPGCPRESGFDRKIIRVPPPLPPRKVRVQALEVAVPMNKICSETSVPPPMSKTVCSESVCSESVRSESVCLESVCSEIQVPTPMLMLKKVRSEIPVPPPMPMPKKVRSKIPVPPPMPMPKKVRSEIPVPSPMPMSTKVRSEIPVPPPMPMLEKVRSEVPVPPPMPMPKKVRSQFPVPSPRPKKVGSEISMPPPMPSPKKIRSKQAVPLPSALTKRDTHEPVLEKSKSKRESRGR